MNHHNDESWRFTARPGQADKVYLVIDGPNLPSQWIEMQPDATNAETWTATATIDPARNRLRYFTMIDGAYLNCGNVGLHAERNADVGMVA